jgi:hypothetical protein
MVRATDISGAHHAPTAFGRLLTAFKATHVARSVPNVGSVANPKSAQ